LSVYVTASRRQAAWRSPAGPLWRQCGRFPPALHRTQCGASVASLRVTSNRLRHREPPSGGVAVSRGAVAEAVREIPTCTAPYAVRCKCRFARNDTKRVYVTASRRQAAWRSPAGPLRKQCGRFPPALHRTQCGRFLASLGMTLSGFTSPRAAVRRRGGLPRGRCVSSAGDSHLHCTVRSAGDSPLRSE